MGFEGSFDFFYDLVEVGPASPGFDAKHSPSIGLEDSVADYVFSDLLTSVINVLVTIYFDIEPTISPLNSEIQFETFHKNLGLWGQISLEHRSKESLFGFAVGSPPHRSWILDNTRRIVAKGCESRTSPPFHVWMSDDDQQLASTAHGNVDHLTLPLHPPTPMVRNIWRQNRREDDHVPFVSLQTERATRNEPDRIENLTPSRNIGFN